MGNRRKGFTLTELLMGIVVMTIMASAAVLSMSVADQTSKREAEKVAAYLVRLVEKSDRIKHGFNLEIKDSNKIVVSWNADEESESLLATSGCTYAAWNFDDNMIYNDTNYPMGAKIFTSESNDEYTDTKKHKYITVTSGNTSPYYVILTANTK